jgi:hypothetical protein
MPRCAVPWIRPCRRKPRLKSRNRGKKRPKNRPMMLLSKSRSGSFSNYCEERDGPISFVPAPEWSPSRYQTYRSLLRYHSFEARVGRSLCYSSTEERRAVSRTRPRCRTRYGLARRSSASSGHFGALRARKRRSEDRVIRKTFWCCVYPRCSSRIVDRL